MIYLKASCCFVLIDEFVALPDAAFALQWNIHSWARFEVDEDKKSFVLRRDGSSLVGSFLYHRDALFSLTEGWDPPPMGRKSNTQWHNQYHLRFTVADFSPRVNLGVVLQPAHTFLKSAAVRTEMTETAEAARIGDDVILVSRENFIEYEGAKTECLALLIVGDRHYLVGDDGIREQ